MFHHNSNPTNRTHAAMARIVLRLMRCVAFEIIGPAQTCVQHKRANYSCETGIEQTQSCALASPDATGPTTVALPAKAGLAGASRHAMSLQCPAHMFAHQFRSMLAPRQQGTCHGFALRRIA